MTDSSIKALTSVKLPELLASQSVLGTNILAAPETVRVTQYGLMQIFREIWGL